MNTPVTELDSADILLDRGVSIPMPAPFWLRIFGKKQTRLVVRRPYWGTLTKITRLWLKTGLKAQEIADNDIEADMRVVAEHNRTLLQIVALGVWRGYIASHFAPILAWWLSTRNIHASLITEAVYRLVNNSEVSDFTNSIRLLETIRTTRNLSPEVKGSQSGFTNPLIALSAF